MFQTNHHLFDLNEYSDDFKPGAYELPTTTHNSPGSLKSRSLKFQDSPFNCSFDEGSQSGHAQAIWQASIKYLQSALKEFVDTAKGMNDGLLFNESNQDEIISEETLEQILMKNPNLKIQQKHEFISDLQSESELMDLMRELSSLFNQNIFHELTYVIFKIWEKRKLNEKHSKKSQEVAEEDCFIPHFDCFWGYEEEELPKVSYSPFFDQKEMKDVVADADKCTEEIAQELYFDNKLRMLNLRECKKESEDEFNVASLFSEFFKTLTRSVYLSAEGFFAQPSEDNTNICEEFNEDFNFEMNDVSALDELQNQNRFVRSFSQDFEDDDEDFEFCSSGNKKRKLQ